MTTSFELASTAYQPWSIQQAGDPYSVYNSLSRTAPVRAITVATIAAPRQDSASISNTSALLAASITQTDARSERIAALRQSIASGTYHVSSEQLAASLLSSLL